MTIARVVVTYANGQTHFDDRTADHFYRLNPKDQTQPIDLRDEERFIDTVEVTYAPGSKPAAGSRLEVWGLQSPAGAATRRQTPAGSASAAKSGGPIATKSLSLDVDRDVMSVAASAGKIGRVRFRATDRSISLIGAEVVYASGPSQSIAVNATLKAGETSPWISIIPGILSEIRLAYRPELGQGAAAVVEVEGDEDVGKSQRKTRGVFLNDGPPAPYVEVPVFFATDRKRETDRSKNGRKLAAFSGEGASDMLLGQAIVTVPTSKDRAQGAIPRPEWDLIFTTFALRDEDLSRDFTLQTIDVLSEGELAAKVKARMDSATAFKDQAFVFVHGYRVGFDDAVFRTAQISHDIGFDSAAFLFSWPSIVSVWGYDRDLKRVQGSRDHFREFLNIVRRQTGAKKIHLIAHSMGSVLLLEVLRELGATAPAAAAPPLFHEIILAAPDITRDNFVKIAERMRPLAAGITVYASANDKALKASGRIALGELPAGYVPIPGEPMIVKGVDTIDVSAISTDFFNLNHSEFADRKQLLKDMELLLQSGTRPPKVRFNVFEEVAAKAGIYWKYIK